MTLYRDTADFFPAVFFYFIKVGGCLVLIIFAFLNFKDDIILSIYE